MRNLVIHPKDLTTDYLEYSYKQIAHNTKIIRDMTLPREEYMNEISNSEKIILMGHGTSFGLLNPNSNQELLIDSIDFPQILRKKNKVFIWCNSDLYVNRFYVDHEKPILYTGMIISEKKEAEFYQINCEDSDILESNQKFSEMINHILFEVFENKTNNKVLLKKIINKYSDLKNPIIKFNKEKIFLGVCPFV